MIHNPLWEKAPEWVHQWSEDQQRLGRDNDAADRFGRDISTWFQGSHWAGGGDRRGVLGALLIVIGSGLVYLLAHPHFFADWYHNLTTGNWYLKEAVVSGHSWARLPP